MYFLKLLLSSILQLQLFTYNSQLLWQPSVSSVIVIDIIPQSGQGHGVSKRLCVPELSCLATLCIACCCLFGPGTIENWLKTDGQREGGRYRAREREEGVQWAGGNWIPCATVCFCLAFCLLISVCSTLTRLDFFIVVAVAVAVIVAGGTSHSLRSMRQHAATWGNIVSCSVGRRRSLVTLQLTLAMRHWQTDRERERERVCHVATGANKQKAWLVKAKRCHMPHATCHPTTPSSSCLIVLRWEPFDIGVCPHWAETGAATCCHLRHATFLAAAAALIGLHS